MLARVRLTSYRVNITISLVIRHKFQYIACSLALNFSGLELRKKFLYKAVMVGLGQGKCREGLRVSVVSILRLVLGLV